MSTVTVQWTPVPPPFISPLHCVTGGAAALASRGVSVNNPIVTNISTSKQPAVAARTGLRLTLER